MSLSQHFEKLGAKLANNRWSWGSVRNDGVIFLRVWQDEIQTIDGKTFVRVTNNAKYFGQEGNPGFRERLEHVELLRGGATGYLIVCTAKNPKSVPREIKSFDRRIVRLAGEMRSISGDYFVSFADALECSTIKVKAEDN